jgi:hypothetical protein
VASLKRLCQHAHKPVPKDPDRLTLAPLTFEQVVTGALATKPFEPKAEERGGG